MVPQHSVYRMHALLILYSGVKAIQRGADIATAIRIALIQKGLQVAYTFTRTNDLKSQQFSLRVPDHQYRFEQPSKTL